MNTIAIDPFNIIGLSIRTTNENGQSTTDIPQLWATFFTENIIQSIPNKIDDTLYCIYTSYELDHTKPYTTILGCKVKTLDTIPAGLTGKTIEAGTYTSFIAQGKIAEGIVFQEWTKIWNSPIPRAFTTDFEVYGAKAQNPDDAIVDIFIAVK